MQLASLSEDAVEKQLCVVEEAVLALHGGPQLRQEVQLLRPGFTPTMTRVGSFTENRRPSFAEMGRCAGYRAQGLALQHSVTCACMCGVHAVSHDPDGSVGCGRSQSTTGRMSGRQSMGSRSASFSEAHRLRGSQGGDGLPGVLTSSSVFGLPAARGSMQ